MRPQGITIDGAQLALIRNRLDGVTRKMSNTLFRTGRSGVLNRVRDFSCCILTRRCELISVADALPIHVLSGPDLMAQSMVQFHPGLQPGDAFLHNSPYHGCGHAADHTILVPVFDDDGVHRFTVLSKAHQADIGNSIPTTYHSAARDVYEEGALIFPAVQVERDYQPIDDIVRMCRLRIRVPDQWWGDFLAMRGAARVGERQLQALAQDVGWDTLDAFAEAWLDYSERICAEAISALPAGRAEAVSVHDPFPGMPAAGVAIKAAVTIDPAAGVIEADLTDNLDCMANGMNLSEASSLTAAYIGLFNSLDPKIPKNAGSLRRFRVKLRDNCVCGVPRHPTSTSVATSNLTERVANAVQIAMASLGSELGMAEAGSGAPCCGVVAGLDARGKPYVDSLTLGFTGGPARAGTDGWQTLGALGGGGQAHVDSIEMTELYFPIEVTARHFLPDTEGAGQFKGASSLYVEFGPAGDNAFEYGSISDGVLNPARGVRGGLPGGAARQYRRRPDGELEPMPSFGQSLVAPNERLAAVTSGGGGYGDPRNRDRAAVARDLAEGWITRERARDVYGLDPG